MITHDYPLTEMTEQEIEILMALVAKTHAGPNRDSVQVISEEPWRKDANPLTRKASPNELQ